MGRLLLHIILLSLLFLPGVSSAKDRDVITANYQVNGVCEQCKARIESSAYTKGVKFAEWNVDTHILSLKYDSSKTSADIILKNIATAGHDNEKYTAADQDYNKLPSCCRYRTVNKQRP